MRLAVLTGAGILCLLVLVVLSRQASSAVELGHYYQHICNVHDSTALTGGTPQENAARHNRLRLLLVSPAMADEIASLLCSRPSVIQQFSGVEVSWRPRMELSAGDLVNESYDVIWNREHFLTGLLPDLPLYYDILLQYDNYAVYWLSLQSTPVLTAEYFRGKRVGLLSDVSSHTHHLLALRSLRAMNTRESDIVPVFFEDASALYNSFYRGDIDLITGGLSFLADQPVYKTLLDDSATAATFFIRKQLQQPALRCDIVDALQLLTPLWQGIQSNSKGSGDC
jgi:hypothetical protein